MEVRPGYKQTEIGVIPESWLVTELEQVCGEPITYGIVQCGPHIENGVPYIRVSDMDARELDVTSMLRTSPAIAARFARSTVKEADIVYALRGKLGEVRRVGRGVAGANLTQGTARLSPKPTVNSAYLLWAMRSERSLRQAELQAKGTTFREITLADLRRIKVPVPSSAEQEAIAKALGDVDALIESQEQLLLKKRRIKQGAMQGLLTSKKRLPGFSGEWEVKPLRDLFAFSGGFTASRDQLSSEGVCYLHYGDIHTSKKPFLDVRSEYQDIPKLDVPLKKVSSASLLDDGDVVFVDASEDDEGTSKHVVIVNPDAVPFISGLHTIIAKGKTTALVHQYRRYCFQTAAIKTQFRFFAVGTKVSGISKSNIARVTLPVPPIPEQIAIAGILSDMDAEIAALEAKVAKAQAIKQSMMQELLTGRIRLI
jgi:type I restriction enzyme S subunit